MRSVQETVMRIVGGTLLLFSLGVAAIPLTIDPSIQYQTIEGFGSFALRDLRGLESLLINDLGVTALRINTGEAGESVDHWVDVVSRFAAQAQRSNEPLVFIASSWTAPPYMKYNNANEGLDPNTNKLKPENYGAYAGVLVDFYRTIQSRTGVDLYGMSFQNEAAFPEPYWSCVYTADEYVNMLKVFGARLEQEGIDTKIYGAEDMVEALGYRNFIPKIAQDPQARDYLDAVAVHGYSDGISPTSTSGGARTWGRLGQIAFNTLEKSAWMTETSGGADGWEGAYHMATNIFLALKYGKLSLWTYWVTESGGESNLLLQNRSPNKRFYASKSFFRYIRPGAVMVETVCEDANVNAVAFAHPQHNTVTVVVINSAGSSASVSLTGDNLNGTFKRYVTSATDDCRDAGEVNAGADIDLPAMSITTLVGEATIVSTARNRVLQGVAGIRTHTPRAGSISQSFDLRGRTTGKLRASIHAGSRMVVGQNPQTRRAAVRVLDYETR